MVPRKESPRTFHRKESPRTFHRKESPRTFHRKESSRTFHSLKTELYYYCMTTTTTVQQAANVAASHDQHVQVAHAARNKMGDGLPLLGSNSRAYCSAYSSHQSCVLSAAHQGTTALPPMSCCCCSSSQGRAFSAAVGGSLPLRWAHWKQASRGRCQTADRPSHQSAYSTDLPPAFIQQQHPSPPPTSSSSHFPQSPGRSPLHSGP